MSEPRNRNLGFKTLSIIPVDSGKFKLEGEVRSSSRNADENWATFHNVSVVGYQSSKSVVFRNYIGTVTPGYDGIRNISTVTETLPKFITLVADETPCDDSTDISILTLNEGEKTYSEARHRKCKEPELPRIPE
ncbi:hypothetical protein [Haloarcula sebkhae]|nr:hypothetical protein [Haloarcula sebkhae]